MAKTIKEMIEVMEWFEEGGEVESAVKRYDDWEINNTPLWDWYNFDYRIKEFQYPMWFKSTSSGIVVKFDNLYSGEVIVGDEVCKVGEYKDAWVEHTNKYHWEEIEEPISKQKVTIEKWLVEVENIKVVIEASDINSWLKPFPTAKKLKLIESYEVEI